METLRIVSGCIILFCLFVAVPLGLYFDHRRREKRLKSIEEKLGITWLDALERHSP